MKEFTYISKYGTAYKECYFRVGHYENNNLAIEIWNNTEGPISKVTVNPDVKLPQDRIAIKDYSENEGMVTFLILKEFIEVDPIQVIISGWVEIPVHMLTEKGKEYLGI